MKKIKAYITSEAYVNGEGCIAGDIRESFTLAAKKEPTGYAEYFDGKGK